MSSPYGFGGVIPDLHKIDSLPRLPSKFSKIVSRNSNYQRPLSQLVHDYVKPISVPPAKVLLKKSSNSRLAIALKSASNRDLLGKEYDMKYKGSTGDAAV